ncbi:ribosome biogenesis factor YjgA [Methylophaga thalassica]|uniref:ribosome biogenesis factor YjgA n=1 Tax=Methylophaga aminisulfidivorans TaxID=230105 RepID=UPI0024E229A3|nr:ribosome biogenesis factor YjgA [Methylophaga aminisulfidivorans]
MSEFEYDQDAEWPADWEFEKSKTQVKQELNALKDLGRSLIELSAKDLQKLDLSEDLYDAIISAQSMSKGALKRQVGYIGGLIADSDHEAISQKLQQLKQPHQGQVKQFHQIEQWRDRLLAGENEVYAELIAEFDDFDVQHVRQLVRNAQREAKQEKPPKSARQLFQYLQLQQQA